MFATVIYKHPMQYIIIVFHFHSNIVNNDVENNKKILLRVDAKTGEICV